MNPEKQIKRDWDAGLFEILPNSEMKRYREYAKAQAKDEQLTLRMNRRDSAGPKPVVAKKSIHTKP
jgi:hypothetical protein